MTPSSESSDGVLEGRNLKLLRKQIVGPVESETRVIQLGFQLPDNDSLHLLGFDLRLGHFLRVWHKLRGRAYPYRKGSFEITIKVYKRGLVSSFLDSLLVGQTARFTGPLPTPWLVVFRLHMSELLHLE